MLGDVFLEELVRPFSNALLNVLRDIVAKRTREGISGCYLSISPYASLYLRLCELAPVVSL
jgi:hypothetical protein